MSHLHIKLGKKLYRNQSMTQTQYMCYKSLQNITTVFEPIICKQANQRHWRHHFTWNVWNIGVRNWTKYRTKRACTKHPTIYDSLVETKKVYINPNTDDVESVHGANHGKNTVNVLYVHHGRSCSVNKFL